MLSDIRPLLNETVEHLLAPTRDVFGDLSAEQSSTTHPARIVTTPGKSVSPVSRENMADAKATIWLLNHPRTIGIGDTFRLPGGDTLKAIGIESRTSGPDTLSKVYLS